jgi:hypothetical protein
MALLAAAAVGMVRLLAGLWRVQTCRRRSRPVSDPDLLAVADDLRITLGCKPVVLRICHELTSPAVIGWLRPVILLPPDCTAWDQAERRTALAHELAHVRRRDWLAGIVAQLGVALHFYHPLLHWLAHRLRLQQELAADELAAPQAGGPKAYLRALARLALRQDDRPSGWLVALLSEPGTLLRRIDMLQTRGNQTPRCSPRWARAGVWASAALVLLAVAALHSPAQKEDHSTPARTETPPPAFDLSYLPPGPVRIAAFRPSALTALPFFREHAAELNAGTNLLLRQFGLPGKIGLKVEEIEQIVAAGQLHTDPKEKEHPSSLLFNLAMVRSVRPFDWKHQMLEIFPHAKGIHHAGSEAYVAYVNPRDPKKPQPLGGFCWYIPDDRTIVFPGSEEVFRRLIAAKSATPGTHAWSKAWKQVDHSLLAVILDDADGAWAASLGDRKEIEPEVVPFQKHAAWVVAGVGGSRIETPGQPLTLGVGTLEECVMHVVIEGRTEAGGQAIKQAIAELLEVAPAGLNARKPATEMDRAGQRIADALLRNLSLHRDGKQVTLQVSPTKGAFQHWVRAWMGDGVKVQAEAVESHK